MATTSPDPFSDLPMAPPGGQLIRLGARPASAEKLVAGTWNRCGNLLGAIAGRLQFKTEAAVAVFCVESGGSGFGPDGRMLIRFENHHFFRHWGKTNRQVFDAHFRFDSKKLWTGHTWRESAAGEFRAVHVDQSSEWRVLEFARTLDDTAAKLSISMGGPQIMGSNYAAAGFESVQQMFDAFSDSERRQIVAFFDFLQGSKTHLALRELDFLRFAKLYNGPGNAAAYSEKIGRMYETFERLSALHVKT
jgi:hypothetical protein